MKPWEDFLQEREKEFGKATIDRWLRTLKILRFDACNLYAEAEDSFQLLWFDEHIKPKLKSFVNNNKSPIAVHLSLPANKAEAKKKTAKTKGKKLETQTFSIQFEDLDPSHIFDEWISSQDNLIVIRLIQELTSTLSSLRLNEMANFSHKKTLQLPKECVNPIFLYGPEGSGKTHLLMALTHKLRSLGYQVIYARAELFTDHVVRAIRAAEMAKFREIYRKADVLIIDDVHTLAKKNATQEEFFHTFNALHTSGKQIILAANSSPQNLAFIEPRLVSRFEWGIVLQLLHLSKKEIIQVIEKRAHFFKIPLHSHTAEFLAEAFSTSLKSAIKAVAAVMLRSHLQKNAFYEKGALTMQQAKLLLGDLIEVEKSQKLTAEKIILHIAEHYGIKRDDIIGKSQSREYGPPRQISMYLCRKLLQLPYMKIGDLFSRDHSTVMTACRQIEKQSKDDNETAALLSHLEQNLLRK